MTKIKRDLHRPVPSPLAGEGRGEGTFFRSYNFRENQRGK